MVNQTTPEAFIDLPSRKEALERLQSAGLWRRRLEFVPAMHRLLLANRDFGGTFLAHSRQVMAAPGELTSSEREMIAAVASAAQDCHY